MENPATTAAAALPSLYEKNKLRIAGALNALGDVMLLLDGRKSNNIPFKMAGWLYTAGAVVITLFGSTNKEQQVKDLTERTAEFVQSQALNQSAELESGKILHQRDNGVLASSSRFLRRHSAQVMLWLYTLGAGAMLTAGITNFNSTPASNTKLKKAAFSEVLVGATSLLVKSVSLIMPEKAESRLDSQKPEEKGIIGWFKEKPMRVFGYGSLATEAFWGYRAYAKFDAGEKWQKSAVTAGSYMLSDLVIAGTNKDAANAVGKMNEAEQAKLENMIAETIAVQAEAEREKLSAQAAEFLKKESIVNGSIEQLRESILQRATKLWSERHQETPALEMQRA